MASPAKIVQDLMDEFGKTAPTVRARFESIVGEITVDLLSQNEGRFKDLEKSTSLSIVTTTRQYRLPADFNTVKHTFYEVNSDGEFVAECAIVPKADVHRRLEQGRYAGYRLAYIQELKSHADGPGKYLILAGDADEAMTFELDYYRIPLETDTSVIRNESILKRGVRSRLADMNPLVRIDLDIYERMKLGFKEDVRKHVTHLSIAPPRKAIKTNKYLHKIARGG